MIKHELNLPLVCTFHTLDRVKAESMPEEVEADMPHRRAEAEASIIECSDAVLASCSVEADQIASLYGGDPGRIRIVPPGRRPRLLRSRSPAPGPPRPRAPARRPSLALRRAHPAAQVRRRRGRDAGRVVRRRERALPPRRGGLARAGRTARRRSRDSSIWPTPGACATRCTSSNPSPTSCCRPTTGRPTSASCPAARSRSDWSPSRRPHAGRRWLPRRWAA